MNMIASEIMAVAEDMKPRIRATYKRSDKIEERDLHSIHFEIQRFLNTMRDNEKLESFLLRRDDEKVMELSIGISDHEAMKGILEKLEELMNKLGKKNNVKVEVELPDKK